MLLEDPNIRWSNIDPVTGLPEENLDLKEMCEYGARAFYNDKCDGVLFRCMPDEIDFINTFMKKYHPTVNYSLSYPNFRTQVT